MTRQIRTVLVSLGHVVELVTEPRTHTHEPGGNALTNLQDASKAVLERLRQGWAATGSPDIWITYHNYYKSPDLLGPMAVAVLSVPYVIIEGSHTPSKRHGPWQARTEAAAAATLLANLHLCFTRQDRNGLLSLVSEPAHLVDLPPFIDTAPFRSPAQPELPRASGPVRLLTVAMMRRGGKAKSYTSLAEALVRVSTPEWVLSLIGDGAARAEIEDMFQPFGQDRVTFAGLLPHSDLPQAMAAHDLFVWPGLHEPFGLVFLEAQAAGLPVVAFRSGGVADTVCEGETAILVPEGDIAALARAISELAGDPARRVAMARAARRFAVEKRGLDGAARVFAKSLELAIRFHAEQGTRQI